MMSSKMHTLLKLLTVYLIITPHHKNQDSNSFRYCHLCIQLYELNVLMFLIKSQQLTSTSVSTSHFISSNTRLGDHLKLVYPRATSALYHHFCFNRIARLWNYLPVINLTLQAHIIKQRINHIFENTSLQFSSSQNCCTSLLFDI